MESFIIGFIRNNSPFQTMETYFHLEFKLFHIGYWRRLFSSICKWLVFEILTIREKHILDICPYISPSPNLIFDISTFFSHLSGKVWSASLTLVKVCLTWACVRVCLIQAWILCIFDWMCTLGPFRSFCFL